MKNITFSIYGELAEGKTLKAYLKVIAHNTADAYNDVYMYGTQIKLKYLGISDYKDLVQ